MAKYLGFTGITKLIELIDTRFATKDSMTAATSSTAGTTGLVPAPAAGDQDKFLRADGTWQAANNYSHPTTAGNKHIPSGGSSGQILKYSADGTATWANEYSYTHPTTAGNKHIPAGGSSGQILKYSADGTATWANEYSYTHPTSAGNKHIPTGGSSGQFLKYSSSGTATWSDLTLMGAASANTAGTAGIVPAPAAGAQTKFLRGDGTWQTVTATVEAITASEIATAWNNISINSASQDGFVSGDLYVTGDVHASHVYNAVYNDYAEFFPKGEETEPGDVIVLDIDHNMGERYIKSRANNKIVVGVHSDEYAFLIGGNKVSESENKKMFIPVSLAGRVKVKFTGPAHKGAYVVASDIEGVARTYIKGEDDPEQIFGILVEEDNITDEIRRLKIKLK